MHEQNEPGMDIDDNEIANDTTTSQNESHSYLSKFFLCIAAISAASVLFSFLYILYLNRNDFSLIQDNSMTWYYVINVSINILVLTVVYILYQYYHKKMIIQNQTNYIRILDVNVFCIIITYILSALSIYLNAFSYTYRSGMLTAVFIVALCMFLVGRYTDNKFLCRISIGYIAVMIALSFINYYLINYRIETYSMVNENLNLYFYIQIFISLCPAIGYLFLGLYLKNQDKKFTAIPQEQK